MDWWGTIWNEKDQEMFKLRFTVDAVCIGGAGSRFQGREAIAGYQARNSGVSSDWTYETTAFLLDGNRFAVEWCLQGTKDRDSPVLGPATGKRFTIRGASIGRRRGDLIEEQADYWDLLGFMVKLGAVPAPAGMYQSGSEPGS